VSHAVTADRSIDCWRRSAVVFGDARKISLAAHRGSTAVLWRRIFF